MLSSSYASAEISPSRVQEIAATLPAKPMGVGQPITNRAAWEKLAAAPGFASVVKRAEDLQRQPMTKWSDDLFLDYVRTGRRVPGEKMLADPRRRMDTFTLAECLENKGRFLSDIEKVVAEICAEREWLYPAHDRNLNNYYGRTVDIDLNVVGTAWNLATVDYLLGDKLSNGSRAAIRVNLQRRILTPFRDMVEGRRAENSWLRKKNNWNAVCLAGVTGAALASLESAADRAWYIAAAQHYIRHFLASFTPDGYCSEGVGYWNYGYGNFVMLGETVRQATGGKVDLLAEADALQPALFGSRAQIINGMYSTISDIAPGTQPDAHLNRYIAERLGLAGSTPRGEIFRQDLGSPDQGQLFATGLFAFLEETLPLAHKNVSVTESPLRSWFKDGGVLICRPETGAATQFAAAFKGGHNGESHNHNDVGSFSVVLGHTMFICDPGGEDYTARTFSANRYESKVLSSFGHALPMVAGSLQSAGTEARAKILRADLSDRQDTLTLDIASAYAVPELKKLERTFEFQRGTTAALTVRDEVEFASPKKFEIALITWSNWKRISATELLFQEGNDAVRVKIDTGGKAFEIKSETLNEDVLTPRKPVRVGITLTAPVKQAVVKCLVTPQTSAQSGK